MKSQKKLIHETGWNVLIILDACRYDVFLENHKDHIKGSLSKVVSEGTCTKDWLKKTFGNYFLDDVIYVSANPYVNSKHVDIVGFDGQKHFWKVIDAWKDGWNDDLKTVMPKKVGKITRTARAKYPNKRIISHFMQPHYPYLSMELVNGGLSNSFSYANGGGKNESFTEKIRGFAGEVMLKVLGWKSTQKIRKKLNLIDKMGNESVAKLAERYGATSRKSVLRGVFGNLRWCLKVFG